MNRFSPTHMKKIPKKLHKQLMQLDAAILSEDLQKSIDCVDEIDWTTYTLAALANLPYKESVSVLRILSSQEQRFRDAKPRGKNVFFQKVFVAALQKGFDPYAEEILWDIVNDRPTPHCKQIAKLLDANPHTNMQSSSFVAYVCSNYLVHPWLLKHTLGLPHAANWLAQEPLLFSNIWNGEAQSVRDQKDVVLAHQYLLNNNAIITANFLTRFQNIVDNEEWPDVQHEVEGLYQTTRAAYEKRLLNAVTQNAGSSPNARKM